MPTSTVRFRRYVRDFAVATACLAGLLGCEDDQTPTPQPAGITVVSGDAQYTRKGTELEEPVVVRVSLADGSPAAGVAVQFQVIEGGGSLSRTVASTLTNGQTSVRWTMGPATGTNRLRATLVDIAALSTTATATSAEFYCAEENPAFAQKFFATHDLMMLTRHSVHTAGMAGVVRFGIDTNGPTFLGETFQNYSEGTFIYVVRDLAFSANGDLFISWNHIRDEIMKVAFDGSLSHFATLDTHPFDVPPGAEIAMTPSGVLVGCDAVGPFYVTCRDTLFRFEDAVFSGVDRDAANNDALACDPASGDVYFIYKEDRWLYRVPFDGTTAGTKQQVAQLPIEESDGARGMVVDGTDGSIYILVESNTVKSIVRVTSAGARTTAYDFFDRGAGDAAGIQSDLAIDRDPVRRYLYTLDTKNNVFLLYRIPTGELFEVPSSGDPESASNDTENERVGLDVIAGP